jgi:hypothetical protein
LPKASLANLLQDRQGIHRRKCLWALFMVAFFAR